MQEEVLLSHKLRDYGYEYQNPFKLKEDNASQSNCQNQLSHPGLSHTEQECQESFIQGKIHNQQNLNEGLKYLQSQASESCVIQNYLVYMLLIIWS